MFAPPGSEWYHHMPDGLFHSYYAGDTVVAGIACRKVVRSAEVDQSLYNDGLRVNDLPTMYVYNTSDTVFAFNSIFNRFTPIYVFNVNDGDTVRLPILPRDVGILLTASEDSSFSFRVDSVRLKLYDTTTLKTVYMHPFGDIDTNYIFNYGSPAIAFGAYAETIGSIYSALMPIGAPGASLGTESDQWADTLRCYTDGTRTIHLISGECGLPPEEVSIVASSTEAIVYPNPATGLLTVSNLVSGANIAIFDADGRVVYQACAAGNTVVIPVSSLPCSVYVLSITQKGFMTQYRSICVVH